MIKRREPGHRNVVTPTITPLVGEHPHTKAVREATEAAARELAAREEAAKPVEASDRIVTGTRR